jgi:hypothetical protein
VFEDWWLEGRIGVVDKKLSLLVSARGSGFENAEVDMRGVCSEGMSWWVDGWLSSIVGYSVALKSPFGGEVGRRCEGDLCCRLRIAYGSINGRSGSVCVMENTHLN